MCNPFTFIALGCFTWYVAQDWRRTVSASPSVFNKFILWTHYVVGGLQFVVAGWEITKLLYGGTI